jgi:hypothetical protein
VLVTRTRQSSSRLQIIAKRNLAVNGIVYCQGSFQYETHTVLNGAIFTERFLTMADNIMYENYLIDMTVNRSDLSAYYLASDLFGGKTNKPNILQWLSLK